MRLYAASLRLDGVVAGDLHASTALARFRSRRRTCFFFKSWMSHHLDVKPRNAFSAAGAGAARRGMEAEAVCVPGRAVGEHADCWTRIVDVQIVDVTISLS